MKFRKHHLIISSIAGFLILSSLYYLILLSPAFSGRKYLEERVSKSKAELKRMRTLKTEWEVFQQNRDEAEKMLKKRGKSFTLLTYLEKVCRLSGIESKIQYMKPLDFVAKADGLKPVGIEMRLEDLHIGQLVTFLYRVEHGGNLLSIPRIKIRPTGQEGARALELTLQINTYM